MYILAALGSALSGAHSYTGFCSVCKKIVTGQNDTFGSILRPYLDYVPVFEYSETDCTVEKLLSVISQKG